MEPAQGTLVTSIVLNADRLTEKVVALDKEEISERLLVIAENLINSGGAAELKARTIAREAGIAVGSVYNLFGDLDGLHRAVNLRLLDRLGAAGVSAMNDLKARNISDPRLRLLALARAYLDFVQAHPGSWPALLAFNQRRARPPEPDAYTARLDTLFLIIAEVLADGDFQLDDQTRRTAARTLWSSVHGIVTSGYAGHSGERHEQEIWAQIDLLVTFFVRGLDQSGSKAA